MRTRVSGAALAALAGLSVLATPVAAQSVNRELIRRLNLQFLYVALPLTLFVMVILIYAVVRFRDNDDPEPTAEDAPLEITWTVATAIILLFVGVSAYSVLANPYVSPTEQADSDFGEEGDRVDAIPDDAVVVHVVARQWEWEFVYEEANVSTRNELVIPAEEDVYFVVTSRDVIHSFTIPALGVKQDTYPDVETVARTRATETGSYDVMCTEFCGAGHSRMRANASVVDGETYREWLDDHRDEAGVTEGPTVESEA